MIWTKNISDLAEKAFVFSAAAYILNFIIFLDNLHIIWNGTSIVQTDNSFYVDISNWVVVLFSYLIVCSILFPFLRFLFSYIVMLLVLKFNTHEKTDYKSTVSEHQLKERAANENNGVLYNLYKELELRNLKISRAKEVYFSLAIMLCINLCFWGKNIMDDLFNLNQNLNNAGKIFTVIAMLVLLYISLRYSSDEDRMHLNLDKKSPN